MYEQNTPKQRAHLRYGSKVRSIRAVQGLVQSANRFLEDTFLQSEVDKIQEIVINALARAEKAKVHELSLISDPTQIGSGTETEHRLYNGK